MNFKIFPALLFLFLLVGNCSIDQSSPAYEISFSRIYDVPPVTDRASTGGVSWIDYDGDGLLDLFITNGYDVSSSEAIPQPNRLYRNIDGDRFEEVEAGPLTSDEGFSSGSAWADINNDGQPDVFVSNQRGQPNFLYRNEGNGNFARISTEIPPKTLSPPGVHTDNGFL